MTPDRVGTAATATRGDAVVVARLHLGPLAYACRRVRLRLAGWLARGARRRGTPRLACLADDDIGRNVVALGQYEDLALRCLFEQAFAPQLARFANACALDVGANIGNHALWFARYFETVVAFEPNPASTHLLHANVLLNHADNVVVRSEALSDRDGTMRFHADDSGNLGRSGPSDHLRGSGTRAFDVAARRGDAVLQEIAGIGAIALVKIDVEGHEAQVVDGLAATIARDRPIVCFEFNGDEAGRGILARLSGWGYAHVHVLEAEPLPARSVLLRRLQRSWRGYSYRLRRVDAPESRRYSLVVASTEPL